MLTRESIASVYGVAIYNNNNNNNTIITVHFCGLFNNKILTITLFELRLLSVQYFSFVFFLKKIEKHFSAQIFI